MISATKTEEINLDRNAIEKILFEINFYYEKNIVLHVDLFANLRHLWRGQQLYVCNRLK